MKIKYINFYVILVVSFCVFLFLLNHLPGSEGGEARLIIVILTFFLLQALSTWRLTKLEGALPLFNIGFILISLTIIYSLYPILSFWLSGAEWTVISDQRMRIYNVTSSELASFSMLHLTYTSSLIVGFFTIVRRQNNIYMHEKKIVMKESYIYAIFALFIAIEAWNLMVLYGNLSTIYVVKQFAHNLSAIQFFLTVAFLYIATLKWQNRFWRYSVILFFLYSLSMMLLQFSGRTYFFIQLITFLMVYHNNVKKITYKFGVSIFVAMMAFFIIWGYVKTNLYLDVHKASVWSGSNEFTSVYATAYDLFYRLGEGTLPEIPFSVRFNDFLLSIPSQFLPLEKWSTSQWYLEVIGLRGSGQGFTFGVIAQGVIGGGFIELLIRGFLTGAIFGVFHNWCRNNSHSLLVNVTYVFVAVRSYHIIRAGTGYAIYDIFYAIVPAIIVILILAKLLPKKIVIN
jgi:hypothetical protein